MVHTWPEFDKALERLRRKYPHIDDDLNRAVPEGLVRLDALPGYSHKLWKARVPSRDMGHGKRGGFRVILYQDPRRDPNTMYLVTIYAKNERKDVDYKELQQMFQRFVEYLKNKT